MFKKLAVAISVCGSLLAAQAAWASQVLYGMTGAGGSASSLYTINAATGASTLIGATGFSDVNAIAIDPTGQMWGISNAGAGTLLKINTSTGAATSIAALSPSLQAPDMAFNSLGTLFTWSEPSPDHLNKVNLTTGATTDVGASGISTARTGLGIDSSDRIILKNFSGNFYLIDPITGAATFLFSVSDPGFDNVLTFNSSDLAYTVDRISGNSNLWTVDMTTQATTLIGATGLASLSALAFSVEPAAVPEPTSFAIVALGLAALGLSRRKS